MSPYPPGEPAVARLAAQMEAIGREIRDMRAGVDQRLERIERQTTATNGRVTSLEADRIKRDATHDADVAHAAEHRKQSERHWQVRLALWSASLGIGAALITAAALAYMTPLFP